MMRRSFSFVLLVMMASAALAEQRSVEIFHTTTDPVRTTTPIVGWVVKSYYVDEIELVEERLSVGLPSNEEIATRVAKKRFEGRENEIANRLIKAWEPLMHARDVGIEAIPAVVVDDRYVVYGVRDLYEVYEIVRDAERSR